MERTGNPTSGWMQKDNFQPMGHCAGQGNLINWRHYEKRLVVRQGLLVRNRDAITLTLRQKKKKSQLSGKTLGIIFSEKLAFTNTLHLSIHITTTS